MKRLRGGTRVPAGFYWRAARWEVVTLSGDGGVLPGGRHERYLRVPMLAMLALAPAMGAALVMFLPLVGFVMVGRELGSKLLIVAGRTHVAPRGKAA